MSKGTKHLFDLHDFPNCSSFLRFSKGNKKLDRFRWSFELSVRITLTLLNNNSEIFVYLFNFLPVTKAQKFLKINLDTHFLRSLVTSLNIQIPQP